MTKDRVTGAVYTAALISAAVLLVIRSEAVAEDMRGAVERCVNVLVPSLFAFTAVSDMLVRSGAYITLSRVFRPLARVIGLPPGLFTVFLISNAAGYPVGAAMLRAMRKNGDIDGRTAALMLCTCYNGGPAFFAGAVGMAVYGSAKMGMLIYCSVLAANVIVAAVLYRIMPVGAADSGRERRSTADILPESVAAAGKSMFTICTMVLAFQAILTMLEPAIGAVCGGERLGAVAAAAFEISNLSALPRLSYRLLPAAAAVGAMGGVCVIMQVKAIVGESFSVKPFLAARAAAMPVAGGICAGLYRLFAPKIVGAYAEPQFIVNFNNFIPSVCLIMMIFLTILQKRLAFLREI